MENQQDNKDNNAVTTLAIPGKNGGIIHPGGWDSEKARQAGIKSSKAKKEKHMMRDTLIELVRQSAPDQVVEALRKHFPNIDKKTTNEVAMCLSMIIQSTKGNHKSFKILSDMIDGTPRQSIEHTGDMKVDNKISIEFIGAPDETPNT
jgi:hypothetical protein